MKLAELFPRTSADYPMLVDWTLEFNWDDPASRAIAIELIDKQGDFLEAGGGEAFEDYCDRVAADVSAMATDADNSATAETIDAFRLLFAIQPMRLTLAWGRPGDTFGWIMWCVARGTTREARLFEFVARFIPQGWRAADDYQALVISELGAWAGPFYMCARKFGGLDAIARMFAEICFAICSDQFKNRVNREENFSALVAMANWASNANEPQAEAWVHFVSGYWVGDLSVRNRAELGILLMTEAHRFTLKDAQWWANLLLDKWHHILTEHLEVQVYAASLRTMDDWRDRRSEILDAIARLARFYVEPGDPSRTALQALESRVNILHPLIYFLTENGTSTDILDVLGAWYVPSGRRECDDEVLVIAAGHPHGVRYLWSGGTLQVGQANAADTFNRVLETSSNALRQYYRATALGDQPVGFDTDRIGIPDEAAAAPFEEAVRAHYRPDLLAAALPKDAKIRSTLTIPATPVPISAMLASDSGVAVAGEASLRKSLPAREVRSLSVWAGDMMHGHFELEALRRAAEIASWKISVHGFEDDSLNAFREFYAAADADVLWVIGHGEHSPFRMDETGLRIGEDRLLTAAELHAITVQGDLSRLLVLNVCSGATTQLHGGIARMGLSQELVAPNQQVLAHLWPIGIYAGLAFGAMFGLELTRNDRESAYGGTVAAMRNPPRLREELRRGLGDDLEIHSRLELQDTQIGNVLSCGAPVLLT